MYVVLSCSRVSKPQIESYLSSVLGGHAPQPEWGVKSGWSTFLAELFTWALGRQVTPAQAFKCVRRPQGQAYEVVTSELQQLGLYPENWTAPLDLSQIRGISHEPTRVGCRRLRGAGETDDDAEYFEDFDALRDAKRTRPDGDVAVDVDVNNAAVGLTLMRARRMSADACLLQDPADDRNRLPTERLAHDALVILETLSKRTLVGTDGNMMHDLARAGDHLRVYCESAMKRNRNSHPPRIAPTSVINKPALLSGHSPPRTTPLFPAEACDLASSLLSRSAALAEFTRHIQAFIQNQNRPRSLGEGVRDRLS